MKVEKYICDWCHDVVTKDLYSIKIGYPTWKEIPYDLCSKCMDNNIKLSLLAKRKSE